jgi:hypothetical protein
MLSDLISCKVISLFNDLTDALNCNKTKVRVLVLPNFHLFGRVNNNRNGFWKRLTTFELLLTYSLKFIKVVLGT